MKLNDKRLLYNINDIQLFIHSNELSPKNIYKLLIEIWKIKHNLSIALISIYGGNIHNIYNVLLKFNKLKTKFIPINSNFKLNVQNCLDSNEINISKMKIMLEKLAINGFVALTKRNDPIAIVMSDNNVCDIITNESTNIGFNESLWNEAIDGYGIVPTSQSMRLAIAFVLCNLENKLKETNQIN